MSLIFFRCILLCLFYESTNLQLVINVKNQGGDVMQENITANISEDTITLEFLRLDGIFVSQLVDFTNEVEAILVIAGGEEELGQPGSSTRALCFLTHTAHADFIAPDAVAKLRQKNAGTVRWAEEDRGWRQTTATAWAGRVPPRLSPSAARQCMPAKDKVYLRAADLARWPSRPGMDDSWYQSGVTSFPPRALTGDTSDAVPAMSTCSPSVDVTTECVCQMEICINWYPCGLKYCKSRGQGGLSYRCGIRTCRRCHRLRAYVTRRDHCPRIA